jgi:cytosine deaminase
LSVSYQDKGFWLRGKSRVVPANRFMQLAFDEARAAGARGEVPIGAVVVRGETVIGRSGNRTRELNDVTAHAEIAAIREAAAAVGSERLTDADLYVTLEPCTMCAAAISFARIRRLYYGAADPKGGAVESGVRFYSSLSCHHVPDVYSGIGESQAADLLRTFFQQRRD